MGPISSSAIVPTGARVNVFRKGREAGGQVRVLLKRETGIVAADSAALSEGEDQDDGPRALDGGKGRFSGGLGGGAVRAGNVPRLGEF